MRRFIKGVKWLVISLLVAIVLLLLPVGYIETFCRQDAQATSYKAIIKDEKFHRTEANSYLTYPEWHIVYAYEGLAKVLETGDEYQFNYLSSITGFWSSFCSLNKVANSHGGGDFNIRSTVHTIGVSFTFELIMKAVYEETFGRVFAIIRGMQKSPQDIYAAKMAADYAQFLQQVPWYEYDFNKATTALWEQPVTSFIRGWERRLALGGEWQAKAGYAGVIAQAVAATGQAQLQIMSVISGLSSADLLSISQVKIIEEAPQYVVIETPRYRTFTNILKQIAIKGGQVVEIAGNDEIMLSALGDKSSFEDLHGQVISKIKRDGYDSWRLLINVKLADLAGMLNGLEKQGLKLEHIYDY